MKCRPSGRKKGRLWPRSSGPTLVAATAAPPDADTLHNPAPGVDPACANGEICENRITSLPPQVPLVPVGASHSVTGMPPATSTFFSFPSAKKPIQRPSGDQNGDRLPSVPAIGRAVSDASGRIHSCGRPSSLRARNARLCPSGDTATRCDVSPPGSMCHPSGGRTLKVIGVARAGAGRQYVEPTASAAAITASAASPHAICSRLRAVGFAAEPSRASRERLEREGKVESGLKPRGRVLLETTAYEAVEARLAEAGQVSRLLAQHRGHRFRGCLALKRHAAGDQLIEDGAERKDVRAMIGRKATHLLGRHVGHGAHQHAGRGVPHARGHHRPRDRAGSACVSLARPKSRIFTRSSEVTNTFSGFRSRWTIPFSCAAASPRAIWTT